jgi:NMD protein affecting ribosome stability and mRNA decay
MDATELEICTTCGVAFHAGSRRQHQDWHDDLADDIIDTVLKELDARAEAAAQRVENLGRSDSGW